MIQISLVKLGDGSNYFSLKDTNELIMSYNSCRQISNFFNVPTKDYNDTLIDKVIQHNNYEVYGCVAYGEKCVDITFQLNSIPKETYIERFKEAFAPQLTLFSLGGV